MAPLEAVEHLPDDGGAVDGFAAHLALTRARVLEQIVDQRLHPLACLDRVGDVQVRVTLQPALVAPCEQLHHP